MDDRDAVLGALPPPKGGDHPHSRVALRSVPDGDLWGAFQRMLESLKGEIGSLDDLNAWTGRAVYDDDVPEHVKSALGPSVQNVWDAEVGVTCAELAVAETGSLLIAARKGRSRLNSLAPPVHVALVRPADIVASLDEALARLEPTTSVLVSGPSRTADVEGVMVMGVHGPKRLIVVKLPE